MKKLAVKVNELRNRMFYLFFVYITAASLFQDTHGICMIPLEDYPENHCVYVIRCVEHAGSVPSKQCHNNKEIFVTFVMENSFVPTLTLGFFGSTNFDARVKVFKAINNTWHTLSQNTFRYYTNCIQMYLDGNNIQTIDANAFGNLRVLELLNISHNKIQHFVPDSFSTSSYYPLKYLDISYNKLTELQANVFSSAVNLETLRLDNNNITLLDAECFAGLANLRHLSLKSNRLQVLERSLDYTLNLETLDISDNIIENFISNSFSKLYHLRKLNVSNNKIDYVAPNCFVQMVDLEAVDFSNNNIHNIIDSVLFINNNQLHTLDFYNNNLTGIGDNVFKITAITYLNLDKNYYSGSIEKDTFFGLKYLKTLNITNQNITSLKSNCFNDMQALTLLNLSRNHISEIDNSSFDGAVLLSVLDLSYNNISNVDFVVTVSPNITDVNLSHNNITMITAGFLNDKPFIVNLDLSHNKIITIQPNSLPLSSLQRLLLTGNRLKGVIEKNTFSPAKYLRFLDLSCFEVTKIGENSFIGLPLLAKLNISFNDIKDIDSTNFIALNNLYWLDISHNELSKLILTNTTLNSLQGLFLNNNKITNFSPPTYNASVMLYLDLSYNNISNINSVITRELPNLKVLRLAHNNLTYFNDKVTNTLSRLVTLDLSSNFIKSINLSYFSDVVDVKLGDNKISEINTTFFENLDSLQSLDLSRNNISILKPGIFRKLKILKLLNLSSNNISKIRYGSFNGLHRIELIDLSKNMLTELDVAMFHDCEQLNKLIIDYNYVKHLELESFFEGIRKLTTISLGGNPISCKLIAQQLKSPGQTYLKTREVVSSDKIYHENNINGIKCGDSVAKTNDSVSTTIGTFEKDELHSHTLLWAWVIILTVILILLIIGFILFNIWNRFRTERIYDVHSSLELNSNNAQQDLLS